MNKPHPRRAELMNIGRRLLDIENFLGEPPIAAGVEPRAETAVRGLVAHVGALVNVVQGLAIMVDNPLYVIEANPSPRFEPVTDWKPRRMLHVQGKGTVAIGGYPFACPAADAIGETVRLEDHSLWIVRGVEGRLPWPNQCEEVSLILRRRSAPTFKVGDRVIWTTVRCPRVGGIATPAEVHGEILEMDSVTAFCREDGATSGHDSVSLSALKHEDHEEEAEEERTLLASELVLSERQRLFACAAIEFCWDNEGGTLPTGDTVTEAELDDMLRQLRGQHRHDCECDACMAALIELNGGQTDGK